MPEHPSEVAVRLRDGKRVSADARLVARAYLDLLAACNEQDGA